MDLRILYIAKETTARVKRKPIEMEKLFDKYTLDYGLVSSIYKEL